MMKICRAISFIVTLLLISSFVSANNKTGFRLENFDYPYPVQFMPLSSQKKQLEMAYMDVKPTAKANGKTIVLFHGKNFCAATWGQAIKALATAGYRVIAMDQIGFCKSSKPVDYQYSFHQLATNSWNLLNKLGIEKAVIVGHSMGGMLATRYALLYPDNVDALFLVNPIGLEDWLAKGVPYVSIKDWYKNQLTLTTKRARAYQQKTYYAGQWRDDYQKWVDMLMIQYRADKEDSAWLSAIHYDMILTQPVVHEFDQLSVPTWLFIGEKDNTAIGKAFVPDDIKKQLGNYPVLARKTAKAIPDSHLILFNDLGHSPQIQEPERFQQALLNALNTVFSKQSE
jgi:pimeloyl-ACP methyl ester carboxylesterase